MYGSLNGGSKLYALRQKATDVCVDSRAIRGDIAVAWLLKYVEENSERIPDVSIQVLPCKKLAAVWLEYCVDQKAVEFQPKPLECGQFRHVFNTDHRLRNVKISNMKRNFSKCSICVKGEAAILRSLRNKDPVKYHEVCGFDSNRSVQWQWPALSTQLLCTPSPLTHSHDLVESAFFAAAPE